MRPAGVHKADVGYAMRSMRKAQAFRSRILTARIGIRSQYGGSLPVDAQHASY